MSTVANGVDETWQLEELVGLGCDYAQGDLLCAPLSAKECGQFLRKTLLANPSVPPRQLAKV